MANRYISQADIKILLSSIFRHDGNVDFIFCKVNSECKRI